MCGDNSAGFARSVQIHRIDIQRPAHRPTAWHLLQHQQPARQQSVQRRPGRGLQQQLRAEASGPTFHRCRHRPQQFDAAQVLFGQQALGLAACLIEKTFGLPWLVGFGAQQGEMGERRQAGGAAFAQGGAKLTDAGASHIGRIYDRNKGNAQVSMYGAARQGVNQLIKNQFESGENRYLQALGIQAGTANNPHKEASWWETALDIVGA